MTICVGISCNDGIVLAADSQLTYEGSHKDYDKKVAVFGSDKFCVGVAGSGYYDLFKASLLGIESELKDMQNPSSAAVRDAIQRVLAGLVKKKRKDMQWQALLCAISVPPESPRQIRFWQDVPNEESFSIIGSGDASVTAYLKSLLPDFSLSVDEALHLASFVISQARNFVPGCGGEIDALTIGQNGKVEEIQRGKTANYEKYMASLHREIYDAICRFGIAQSTDFEVEACVRSLLGRVKSLKEGHFANYT